jgi:glycerol uptake facilitator protein
MSYGANAGYAINPARDFGPRLFAFFAGWGKTALPGTFNNGAGFAFSDYFWIPIVGPLIGGVLGVVIYDLFIGDILHARLKMVENVAGPIEEAAAPGEVPEARQPAASETNVQAPSDVQAPRDQHSGA